MECLKCNSPDVEWEEFYTRNSKAFVHLGDSVQFYLCCNKCGATTVVSYDNPTRVQYYDK